MIVTCGDRQISINCIEWRPGAFEFGFRRRIQAVYAYISWKARKFSTPLRYPVIGVLI
jgi:hypothetical protein